MSPAGDHAIDLEIAVPLEAHLDQRVTGDEVGPPRIADDEVADLLRPEPDPVEMIARLDVPPLELPFQEMRGDRPTLDPDHGDDDGEEDQHAKSDEPCDPSGGRTANDDDRPGFLRTVTPLLAWPPLAHWLLLTRSADDRSESGMTLPTGNNSG